MNFRGGLLLKMFQMPKEQTEKIEKNEQKNIASSSIKMSVITTISRILGLIRDQFQAFIFGTSFVADSFAIGFMIPNLLRRLFAEGNMSVSFIPIFTDVENSRSKEDSTIFFKTSFTVLFFVVSIVVALGILFCPILVRLLYTSAHDNIEALNLATSLSMIMFPYLLFISLAAMVAAMLNIHGVYSIPAASPIVLNICIIGIVSIFYFLLPNVFDNIVYALALAVLIGGVLQFAYQLPFLKKQGYAIGINFNFKDKDLVRMFKLFIPGVFSASIYQVNLLVSTFLAGSIGEGRISSITYTTRLHELVLGVFAVSIATVMLPTLSKAIVENRMDDVKSSLFYSIRFVALSTIPATLGFIMLADEIVKMLFGSGQFNQDSIALVGVALKYLSLSLFFVASYRILVQSFFAMKDTRTPAMVALVTFIINASVGAICIFVLHTDIKGISIASVSANIVSFIVLYFLLNRRIKLSNTFSEIIKIVPTVLASVVMGIFVYGAKYWFIDDSLGRLSLTIRLIPIIVFAVLVYGLSNVIFKNKDFLYLADLITAKIKRKIGK